MSRADVEAGERRWLDSMNGGDAAGVAAVYSQDARLMPPNAEILEGRDAIEGFCKEFAAMGAKLAFQLITVHEAGDLSVAVGTYVLDFTPPGAPEQHERGKYIEVWKKTGDSWQIVDDMFNSSDPLPA